VTWLRRLWHRCAARPGAVPRPPWLLRRAVNERGTDRRALCLSASSLIASAFWGAHFEGANLVEAHLESANLLDAQFDERARLGQAHLEKANLVGATVSQKHLESAFGDAATGLPVGLSRPVWWSSVKSSS
jgi:Pentapeptide repeats (8 copies)